MEPTGRSLVVLVVCGGLAAVTSIGCELHFSNYPALTGDGPTKTGGGVGSVTTTTTGTGGEGGADAGSDDAGTTDAGTLGEALSVCDVAEALAMTPAEATCKGCENSECLSAYSTCGTACSDSTDCVASCNSGSPAYAGCVSGCIDDTPAYATFLACMLTNCASSCGVATPLACTVAGI